MNPSMCITYFTDAPRVNCPTSSTTSTAAIMLRRLSPIPSLFRLSLGCKAIRKEIETFSEGGGGQLQRWGAARMHLNLAPFQLFAMSMKIGLGVENPQRISRFTLGSLFQSPSTTADKRKEAKAPKKLLSGLSNTSEGSRASHTFRV